MSDERRPTVRDSVINGICHAWMKDKPYSSDHRVARWMGEYIQSKGQPGIVPNLERAYTHVQKEFKKAGLL